MILALLFVLFALVALLFLALVLGFVLVFVALVALVLVLVLLLLLVLLFLFVLVLLFLLLLLVFLLFLLFLVLLVLFVLFLSLLLFLPFLLPTVGSFLYCLAWLACLLQLCVSDLLVRVDERFVIFESLLSVSLCSLVAITIAGRGPRSMSIRRLPLSWLGAIAAVSWGPAAGTIPGSEAACTSAKALALPGTEAADCKFSDSILSAGSAGIVAWEASFAHSAASGFASGTGGCPSGASGVALSGMVFDASFSICAGLLPLDLGATASTISARSSLLKLDKPTLFSWLSSHSCLIFTSHLPLVSMTLQAAWGRGLQ